MIEPGVTGPVKAACDEPGTSSMHPKFEMLASVAPVAGPEYTANTVS